MSWALLNRSSCLSFELEPSEEDDDDRWDYEVDHDYECWRDEQSALEAEESNDD